jgi:hypothetical protein
MRLSSNETPLGFGGTATDVGFGLGRGVGAGMGLRGESVAARLVLAVVVGLAVTVTASARVGTGAADGAPLAPHPAITPATITASAVGPQAMWFPPARRSALTTTEDVQHDWMCHQPGIHHLRSKERPLSPLVSLSRRSERA